MIWPNYSNGKSVLGVGLLILAAVSIVYGEHPKENEKESVKYLSKSISEVLDRAVKDVSSAKPQQFSEDMNIFYDLRRGDLLALCLRSSMQRLPYSDYDSFADVIRLINTLPENSKREAVIHVLSDEKVNIIFHHQEKDGELEASRHVVMSMYSELILAVLHENDVNGEFDGTKPDSIQKTLLLLRQKAREQEKATTTRKS